MYKSVHWCIQRHYIAIPCLFYCLCVKNTEYISHYCWMNVFSGRLFLKMYLTIWKKSQNGWLELIFDFESFQNISVTKGFNQLICTFFLVLDRCDISYMSIHTNIKKDIKVSTILDIYVVSRCACYIRFHLF